MAHHEPHFVDMRNQGRKHGCLLEILWEVQIQKLKTPVFQEAASKFKGILIESESAAKDRKRNNQ